MESLGLALFAGACAALVYSFLLYPLIVPVLAFFAGRPPREAEWEPAVSLVITARNEESDIASKVENALRTDYPRERMEILVASDASTDRTDAIVTGYAGSGVRLVRGERRGGKTAATQSAVRCSTGEVLVFSDATGMYDPPAVRRLVRTLADPSVGCVSGRVEYHYGESLLARGFRVYQRLVKALRRGESALGVLTSVSGSIHAVRRRDFPALAAHQNYDLVLPMEMAQRGLRVVYRDDAVSLEAARERPADEFRARVRAAIAALSGFSELRRRGWLLRSPLFLWALVSGKILRWFTPLWLIVLLAGHLLLALRPGAWRWALVPHAGFYLLAALGAILPSTRLTRPLSGPLFVGTVCAAFVAGVARFLSGERAARWESTR